ncbi:putative regulator of Ras-like GTPase activity (Roadblock/LC7/MglB family) [Stackebrandtia albiflava]|uniref:Putative regulator of Ras-like GTPase activity (Roadblock/LC7/MglB family) n=1 Tax=Stackebrandtia albiflava TaxID=406432 RepID=A0A562VCJ1_9ACTN|nr:roadblock/LC7 domain-containing protein [Stackebrandtia albiflava]TWJ15582.1 putative regulator of Ras-like GTPase activity (Roadblock/LC7/MglB family) [Stackebrandtia albiflava]
MSDTIRNAPTGLQFLLDGLISQVAGVQCALLVSADGLKKDISSGLDNDRADQLAAVASGLFSLARNTGGGGVRQVVAELDDHIVFVSSGGSQTRLVVVAGNDTDVSVLAFEMAQLIKGVAHHTATPARSDVVA